MSRFNKQNFIRIIIEIEQMEMTNENYWVPVGILEYMYDDDCGYIDQYFHTPANSRNPDQLWLKLNDHLIRNGL